ncbi:MAG: 4Fe-4S ferredoxin N-terminal domain-containing protein [Halodesulfurarchaeum sp.]|nr:4Fe-4S ferredoxin N-terminal domain-containing protein [Halodesulfurarchaeum sp.]
MYNQGEPHAIREDDLAKKAEDVLEDVPFDTDLGERLARDAQRVTRGELSREEFHRIHHKAVMEEFGMDERATKPEGFDDE